MSHLVKLSLPYIYAYILPKFQENFGPFRGGEILKLYSPNNTDSFHAITFSGTTVEIACTVLTPSPKNLVNPVIFFVQKPNQRQYFEYFARVGILRECDHPVSRTAERAEGPAV